SCPGQATQASQLQGNLHTLAIKRQLHRWRKQLVSFFMRKSMRDMREHGLLCADASCGFNGLFDREVRNMPLPLKRIEHQQIQIAQQVERQLRDRTDIGAVSEITNAKAQNRHIA